MENGQNDLMLTLPVDKNHRDSLLTTTPLGSSQSLYSCLMPDIWRKIFSFLIPEHLRIPCYTRGWMGKQWKLLIDFLKLRAVFPYAQDDLYQTLCAECTFSVSDSVRQMSRMKVVPSVERAAKFFCNIGLKHFRHVKSIQFIITGTKTGAIRSSEARRMLDALETLLQYCSSSMKLKDAQLRCHTMPLEYYYEDQRNKISIPGYVLDGPKPDMSFIGPRNKNLKAFWRGFVSLERLNTTLMRCREEGDPVNFMEVLPPELRLKVYNMLLVLPLGCMVIMMRNLTWKGEGYDLTPLLAVKSEMRLEISKLLYRKCRFYFDARFWCQNLVFMDNVGFANAENICNVTIELEIEPGTPVFNIKA
ncbi:hypothetical protein MMC34_002966 [Xylographa carneopallida]|nr:hypothetical protein [Xylographa carneopallida]